MKSFLTTIFALTMFASPVIAHADKQQPKKATSQKNKQANTLKDLQQRAANGDAVAQYKLGIIYLNGTGVLKDYQEAMFNFRLSAVQKNMDAQYSLGRMYEDGYAAPQDYETAVEWYVKAADQGHNMAQYSLGLMYMDGQGVANDLVQAHMWFNLASAKGNEEATDKRKQLDKTLSQWQLGEAQSRAREWQKSHP